MIGRSLPRQRYAQFIAHQTRELDSGTVIRIGSADLGVLRAYLVSLRETRTRIDSLWHLSQGAGPNMASLAANDGEPDLCEDPNDLAT